MTLIKDFDIDERCSKTITVITRKKNGLLRDITGASVEWNATQNGIEKASKSTALATITLGATVGGIISSFSFTLLPDDTDLADLTTNYGTPVVWYQEGGVTIGSEEFVAIRGRMFVMPRQTGV